MYIGEVSKRTGFSRDTIRFYEKLELIRLDPRDRYQNNFKNYSEDVVKNLLMVKELKEFGFTLNEIKNILRKRRTEGIDCESGVAKVQEKISDITKQIIELQATKKRLIKTVDECPESCMVEETLEIIEASSV